MQGQETQSAAVLAPTEASVSCVEKVAEQSNDLKPVNDIECGVPEEAEAQPAPIKSHPRPLLASIIFAAAVLAICGVALLRGSSSTTSPFSTVAPSGRELGGGRVQVGAHVPGSIQSMEGRIGAGFDNTMVYQNLNSAKQQGYLQNVIQPEFNAGNNVVLVIDIDCDLGCIANSRDIESNLRQFGNAINSLDFKGKTLWVRPLHEYNGDWYQWGLYAGGNNNEEFKAAFRKVVTTVRGSTGKNVKFQLSPNCDPPGGKSGDLNPSFPGTDVVDMVCCSAYNRFGVTRWHNKYESFAEVFRKGYQRMSELPGGKPLCVAETSSVPYGGDRGEWFRGVMPAIRDQFPRVTQVNFFLENKDAAWEPTSGGDYAGLRDAIFAAP